MLLAIFRNLRSQGKSGKNQKVRESQGILHSKVSENSDSQIVREFKSTRVQKLPKMQKKRTLHRTVQNFACLLRLQIICTCTSKFGPPRSMVVSSVIASA